MSEKKRHAITRRRRRQFSTRKKERLARTFAQDGRQNRTSALEGTKIIFALSFSPGPKQTPRSTQILFLQEKNIRIPEIER